MDADGLRALVREMLPWFDDVLHARFVNARRSGRPHHAELGTEAARRCHDW